MSTIGKLLPRNSILYKLAHLYSKLYPRTKKLFTGSRKQLTRQSASFQEQYQFLAESLQDVKEANSNLPKWNTQDLTLRLAILSVHKFRKSRQLLETMAPVQQAALPVDELLRLNYHVKLARAAYASDLDGLWWRTELSTDSCELVYHSSDDTDGKFHLPIHFIIADHTNKRMVLSIRGSKDLSDIAIGARIRPLEIGGSKYHGGIATAAVALSEQILPRLKLLITQYPDYDFSITGHSLGAGIAALMAILLRSELDGSLRAVCFACPPVCSLPVARAAAGVVTTVINGHDFVPRFSAASLAKLKREVNEFEWKDALQEMVPEYQKEVNDFARQTQDRVQGALLQAIQTSYKSSELIEIATAQLQVSRFMNSFDRVKRDLRYSSKIGFEDISKNEQFYLNFLSQSQVQNMKSFLAAKLSQDVLKQQINDLNKSLTEAKQNISLISKEERSAMGAKFKNKISNATSCEDTASRISTGGDNVQWVSISKVIPKLQDEIHKMFTKRQQLLEHIKEIDQKVQASKQLIHKGGFSMANIDLLLKRWENRRDQENDEVVVTPENASQINYEEDLFPAGSIFAVLHSKEANKKVLTNLHHEYFEELLISPKMASDHLLINYRQNLDTVISDMAGEGMHFDKTHDS